MGDLYLGGRIRRRGPSEASKLLCLSMFSSLFLLWVYSSKSILKSVHFQCAVVIEVRSLLSTGEYISISVFLRPPLFGAGLLSFSRFSSVVANSCHSIRNPIYIIAMNLEIFLFQEMSTGNVAFLLQ